jgi:hypothetical protein
MLAPVLVLTLWYSRDLILAPSVALSVAFAAAFLAAALFLGIQLARRLSRNPRRILVSSAVQVVRSRRVVQVACVAAILILVTVNFAMSPLNTSNANPGFGNGYSFNYGPSPTFGYMAGLVSEMAPQQTVVASDNLFPFVANNAHAYSLLWFGGGSEILPFNSTNLPTYALLSTSQWFAVPGFLVPKLFNPSVYGIRGELYSSDAYPGTIYLFKLGYTGPTDLKKVTPFPTTTVLCGHDLTIGASGAVRPYAGSRCGTVVESSPASNLSGLGSVIWYGPYATLLPGNYTVTVSVEGNTSGPADAPVFRMDASAVGTGYWYQVEIRAYQVSATQWTNFTFHFNLSESHPHAEWRGYVSGQKVNGIFVPGNVVLNYIEVDYAPPPSSG